MPPPPHGTSARVLLLFEEEKDNILLIKTFPSFLKGGVSCPKGNDGVVNKLL